MKLIKEEIEKSIKQLDSLDLAKASIEEIKDLLFPLFSGYEINVPRFDPGVYLYRSRICEKGKSVHLAELSYPPKHLIKEYGRANDIGEPIFYGSISKNIPFFELSAKAGDELIVSVWKTTTKLLVNHVGFSEEVFKQLASGRDPSKIYGSISDAGKFNDLNTFVYNYLASAFTRKVSRSANHLYKLSVAITHKLLMGNLIEGLLYPTIAMSANSDNIAVKPDFVDKHMQFVAVEYLRVDSVVGDRYTYTILDSATEVSGGRLDWSGRVLGWTLQSNQSLTTSANGGQWIGHDNAGVRVDPKPTTLIVHNLTKLARVFQGSFPESFKLTKDIPVTTPTTVLAVKGTLVLDFIRMSRFLAFYIPSYEKTVEVVNALLSNVDSLLCMEGEEIIECKDDTTHELICTNKELAFNNEIHIFSESPVAPMTSQYDLKVFDLTTLV